MANLDPTVVALITGAVGKIFIEIADSMPAPPAGANYFWRWAYDLAQHLASNSAKVGSVR